MWCLAYCVAVWSGRRLLVGDAQIAATWPAIGIAFAWLVPFVSDRRQYRRAPFWLVIAFIVASSALIALHTGRPTPVGNYSGVSNCIAAVVTAELYLSGRGSRRREFLITADLVTYVTACTLGVAASWLAVPVVAVAFRALDWAGAGYWYLRNLSSLAYLGLIGLLVLGERRRYVARESPWYVVPVALALTAGMVLFLTQTDLSVILSFAILLCAVVASSLMSVLQCYVYLVAVGGSLIALGVAGQWPYDWLPTDAQGALLHFVLLVALVVSLALSVDREERAVLFEELSRDRMRLAEQTSLLRTILGSMSEGVVVLDAKGAVLLRNQAAVGMMIGNGEGVEGALGGAAREVGSPRSGLSGLGAPLDRGMVLPREAPPLPPVDLVLRDAVGVPIRTVSVESHMLDAGELGSVAILRDVTEERRQLSELRTFARVVAHDLRQPLAAIVMWVDTLRQELGDRGAGHAAEEGLDHISAATVRMDTLLGDLLAYALARDGNLVVTEFDLQALVDEVVAARLPAEATPPTIQAEVPFQLRGDRALIRQVVDNVVGNSLKYTVDGHPAEIEISGQRTASGYLTMTIADRGIGVPVGEEASIFEEFHRVSGAARRYPGTGLGLAISRRVVERHHGFISARQRPGGGTCVDITLPG